MYIHNLYNDLMLSVSILLDHVIFEDSKIIKRYEFNLGNRTFQFGKDPKVNVDLPAAIVAINDETPYFGQRTESIKRFTTPNINNTPVLFNKSNNAYLMLNEEYTHIPISITINTESQLQAKELSHIIRRYLPLNKWIQQLKFMSFLEIEPKLLNKYLFNPYEDNILNLFSKFDRLVGLTQFCFSVQYEPQIRLDSISAAVPDSTQRTYQVTADLTYGLQWPVFLYCDKVKYIENINIHFNEQHYHPISQHVPITVFMNKQKDIKNFIIYDDESIVEDDDHIYFIFELDQSFINVSDDQLSYNLLSTANRKYLYDVKPYEIIEQDNKITFQIDNQDYKYLKPSLVNPVFLQAIKDDVEENDGK